MAEFPLSYRRLRKILRFYGIQEDASRGKGSHRMLIGIVEDRIVRFPTKCHNENDLKPLGVIKTIRRTFKLTSADGVSDDEFYGRA